MANLTSLTSFKSKLMQKICQSTAIVNLLKTANESSLVGTDMPYRHVFPYMYVPEINEDAKTYVCFKMSASSINSEVLNKVVITIYIMTDKDTLRLPNSQGMRTDVIAHEVDKILNRSGEFGIGQVKQLSVDDFIPATGYYGIELRYYVNDIDKALCGGN